MKGFFRKLFNVYAGEERNALRFAILGFMWALAVTSGLKFADALFLLHVGSESLPLAYTLTACVMIVLATFLLQALHHFSTHKIFIAVLISGTIFYTFAYFCLAGNIGTETKWLWFALRIFGSLFFAIVVSCYWTFVDHYYHLQDAKRLFSLFSSAIFLGIATTGVIMRSGLIEFQHLIIFIIALLLVTCTWILNITKTAQQVYDEDTYEGRGDQSDNSFRFLMKSILSSRFTMLLMLSNFLIYLLMINTEYSYMSAFDHHFDRTHPIAVGDEEDAQLTLFLGQLIAGVSIINLIFGLFVYSRLVRRFGVNTLILFTPIFLFLTYIGWLSVESLLFPIMGFFVVEGMIYTVDDNNFTLLLNAVPPKVKHKIRLMIETFFEPIGMLVSSFLITYAPVNSRVLGLILSSLALTIALVLRRKYLRAIFNNLLENTVHLQRSTLEWFTRMNRKEQQVSERRLIAMLYRGNERDQLFAAEGLLGFGDNTILQRLLQRSEAFSPEARIKFLRLISQSRFETHSTVVDWLDLREQEENDPQVHAEVHFYLARLGLLELHKVAHDLDSRDLSLKGAAILSLQKSWGHISSNDLLHNRNLASQYLQKLLSSNNEEDICMAITILGINGDSTALDILLPYLKSASLKITRASAACIAQIVTKQDSKYAHLLIAALSNTTDTELRQSFLKALGKMCIDTLVRDIIATGKHFRPHERRLAETIIKRIGPSIVPTLLNITRDITMPDRCRVLAGRILGSLDLPLLRENLYEIINVEIERAYFYFYHKNAIPARYPELELSLLRDALKSSFHSVLDFIIQLLAVAGESEDCELLSRSLRSPNPKVRSHVVETLEKTCEPHIYRVLYPLIADLPDEEKTKAYLKEGHTPLSLTELLDKMSQSSMPGDQIMAAAMKYRLKMPDWRESLRRQMASNEEIFQHFAYELLET